MTLYTVPGTGYAQLIVNAGDGPTMVINRDETTQLYVGDDNSVASKNGTGDIDIIDPLSYIVYDGIGTKYAISADTNTSIQVDCVKGATNWAPSPQQAALQISLLGLATESTQQLVKTNTASTATNTTGVAKDASLTPLAKDTTVSTVATNTTGVAKDASLTPLAKDTSVAAISTQGWAASGLAKETGGNLANQTALLSGTFAGALISTAGRTIAQETAAMIATGNAGGTPGGAPLLNNHGQSGSTQSGTIAASTVDTLTAVNFSQPGFEILLTLKCPAATTVPFCTVTMTWTDSVSGDTVWQEQWYLACGNSATAVNSYIARGLTRGNTLTVKLGNPDAAQIMTYSMAFFQTAQFVTRTDTDFRLNDLAGFTVPGLTTPDLNDSISNILATRDAIALAAATNDAAIILPVYSGKVKVFAITGSGTSDMLVSLLGTALPSRITGTNLLWQGKSDANGLIYQELALPKGNCSLQMHNGNAAAFTCRFYVVTEEY